MVSTRSALEIDRRTLLLCVLFCVSVVSNPGCHNWHRILEEEEMPLVLLLLLLLLLLYRHERLADLLRFLAIAFSQ